MARIRTSVGIAALGLALLPLSSAADPIRAVLAIDVVTVQTGILGFPAERQPFSAQFPLPVTFDDRVIFSQEFCCPPAAFVRFGPPTFGDIPLEHFGILPGILPNDAHGTVGIVVRTDDGSFNRRFSMTADISFDPSLGQSIGNAFFIGVAGTETGFPTPPSLDPHDLISSVRPPRESDLNFNFFTARRFSDDEVRYIVYNGQATVLSSEPAPIPEPSSLILMGTVIFGAALRKRILGRSK